MRFAIPMAGGRLCMHFGHCEQFLLLDTADGTPEVTARQLLAPPAHAPGVLPEWLREQDVQVVLAGGIGSHARSLLAHAGVDVVAGVPDLAPEELVAAHVGGTLSVGANACDH